MPGINGNTVFISHLNGTDGSTSPTDVSASAHTITCNGNAQIDTAQSQFGGASCLFDGSGDFLSVPHSTDFEFGTNIPITCDFWVRFNSVSGDQILVTFYDDGGSRCFFYKTSSGQLLFYADNGGSPLANFNTGGSLFAANTWYHIALVLNGNDEYIFVDGVSQSLTYTNNPSSSTAYPSVSQPLWIGKNVFGNYLNGWIDEFRIQKNEAVWTANFTPEVAEYTAGTETVAPDETVYLHDDWIAQTNPDTLAFNETVFLSDSFIAQVNPDSQVISDTVFLSDSFATLRSFTRAISTDLHWQSLFVNGINTFLSWILAVPINTDLSWQGTNQKVINTDLRWLAEPFEQLILNPISEFDTQIFVNGTDILLGNDIDIRTGNIVHTIGQKSTGSFVLARRHDDLNRTHLAVASQITAQNPVQIYIDGHLEFDGFIATIQVASDSETVSITALMEQPDDLRNFIDLPMPSLNEPINLYHCLVNNVQIDDPKPDITAVIIGDNGRYWSGSSWVFFIEDAQVFATDIIAQSYIDSYVDNSVDLIFESQHPSVASHDPNPQYFKGVKVNLGQKIVQQVDRFRQIELIIAGKGMYAKQIETGVFIPKQNYSYFWNVQAKNIRLGTQMADYRYIGTSLGAITTDLWVLRGVEPLYQKIKENLVTELGYYYVGEAPYKEISPKAGQFIPHQYWVDKNDGLYNVTDAAYNYVPYAQLIADLTYDQLLNVGGDIVPVTSANIEITFDAYYYYDVHLLTRVNVTNTSVPETYDGNNGFPVSVKSINIDFSTMRITLISDNKLSQLELNELEAEKPDSIDFTEKPKAVRVFRKFDLKSYLFVSN